MLAGELCGFKFCKVRLLLAAVAAWVLLHRFVHIDYCFVAAADMCEKSTVIEAIEFWFCCPMISLQPCILCAILWLRMGFVQGVMVVPGGFFTHRLVSLGAAHHVLEAVRTTFAS